MNWKTENAWVPAFAGMSGEVGRIGSMLEYKGYLGTVEADDGAFFGRVTGLRDVVTFEGDTFAGVERAFRDSVDDYLAFCVARGEARDW